MSLPKNLQDCYFYYYSACRKVINAAHTTQCTRHLLHTYIGLYSFLNDKPLPHTIINFLFISFVSFHLFGRALGNKLSISTRTSGTWSWTCLPEMGRRSMLSTKLSGTTHGNWEGTQSNPMLLGAEAVGLSKTALRFQTLKFGGEHSRYNDKCCHHTHVSAAIHFNINFPAMVLIRISKY